MRAAGELADQGRPSTDAKRATLAHLGVSRFRAVEWDKLAAIEPVLDAEFAKATRAGRLVAESALVKLGAAQQTTQRRREASRTAAPLPEGMELRKRFGADNILAPSPRPWAAYYPQPIPTPSPARPQLS
jgi:hypothetical protein